MKAWQVALLSALIVSIPSKANILTSPVFEARDFSGWTLILLYRANVFEDNWSHGSMGNGLFEDFNSLARLSERFPTAPEASSQLCFPFRDERVPSNEPPVSLDENQTEPQTDVAHMPEPASLSLVGLGALGLAFFRRRSRLTSS
jgi:hypothetical protein